MSDKELDNIFKSKLHSREFEFNPDNWKAMEQMLDQRRSAGLFYWWSTAAILSFGLLVFAALNFFQSPLSRDGDSIQNTISNTEENQPLNNTQSEVPSATNDLIEDDNNGAVKNTENNAPNSHTGKAGAADNREIKQHSGTSTPAIVSRPESNSISDPTLSPPLNSANIHSNISENTRSEEEFFSSSLLFSELKNKGIPHIRGLAEAQLLAVHKQHPYTFERFGKQHEWWVSSGPDFSPGDSKTGVAAAWFAELNYKYRFSKQWGLETGLGYFARNSPDINWSSDSVFYNFGQEVLRTEVEHKRLDYINLPLKITYNLNARHQFHAGVYTAFLVNVQRDVKQTHIHFKGNTEVNEKRENGLSGNFRKMDYGFGVGYIYQYTPQLGMGIQLQTGLTDITRYKHGVLNDFHRNVNTRLILRYRLF